MKGAKRLTAGRYEPRQPLCDTIANWHGGTMANICHGAATWEVVLLSHEIREPEGAIFEICEPKVRFLRLLPKGATVLICVSFDAIARLAYSKVRPVLNSGHEDLRRKRLPISRYEPRQPPGSPW